MPSWHGFEDVLVSDIPRVTQPYHDPQDEPTAQPLDPSFFDFDNGEPLGKEELKGLLALYPFWSWLLFHRVCRGAVLRLLTIADSLQS